jgi:hypothetical protein
MGTRDHHVERFRSSVTVEQMERAASLLPQLSKPGILELRRLRLPEFGMLTFLSKLRSFLDPEKYCVLDRKLLRIPALKSDFKVSGKAIPVTVGNERAYQRWVDLCGRIADTLTPPRRPVDVERGFFHLVDTGQIAVADSILRKAADI